jgi:hypothetical protein
MKKMNKNLFLTAVLAILCVTSYAQQFNCVETYAWSSPIETTSNNTAKGVINGVKYDYYSGHGISLTGGFADYEKLSNVKDLGMPNQTSLKHIKVSTNRLTFETPIKNPILAFGSIGDRIRAVPIKFDQAFVILSEVGNITQDGQTITGQEGAVVVQFQGTFEVISFFVGMEENSMSIMAGAECVPECVPSYSWSSPVEVTGRNSARGEVDGVGYNYKSGHGVSVSGGFADHEKLPENLDMPNQTSIKHVKVTSNSIEFDTPVKNPVLAFGSIGDKMRAVPIKFDQDFVVMSKAGNITEKGKRDLRGQEGAVVLRFKGTFKTISFSVGMEENSMNIMVGSVKCAPKCVEGYAWSSPIETTSNNTAKGVINGVKYDYYSGHRISLTGGFADYEKLSQDKDLGMPNQTSLKHVKVAGNSLTFETPVKNPILAFGSIGDRIRAVPIRFDQAFVILSEVGNITQDGQTITGQEGAVVVQFQGTFEVISFFVGMEENSMSIMAGAAICK